MQSLRDKMRNLFLGEMHWRKQRIEELREEVDAINKTMDILSFSWPKNPVLPVVSDEDSERSALPGEVDPDLRVSARAEAPTEKDPDAELVKIFDTAHSMVGALREVARLRGELQVGVLTNPISWRPNCATNVSRCFGRRKRFGTVCTPAGTLSESKLTCSGCSTCRDPWTVR